MVIGVGERIPDVTLRTVVDDALREISMAAYCRNRVVVMFAVPGAFTPACSARHLPGCLERRADFTARGVEAVACLAVNDAFVMSAWALRERLERRIDLLADGNADFSRAVGLTQDLSALGLGVRSLRYAMTLNSGVVQNLFVDPPGAFEVSAAEHVLANL